MRRKLLYLLGLVVLITGAVLVFQSDFDSNLFLDGLRNVRPVWLAGSVLMTFSTYAIRAIRWQVLLASLKRVPIGPLLLTTILGFSAIFALGRAGEVVRPLWIARSEAISVTGSFAAIVLERVFDLLFLVMLFGLSLALAQIPSVAESSIAPLRSASLALMIGSVVALGGSIVFEKYAATLIARLGQGKLSGFLDTFRAGLAAASDFRHLAQVFGYSLILWLVAALQFWVMLVGLNVDLPLASSNLIMFGAALGSIAQVPGIGGGYQAAIAFCLTRFFLVPVETAVAASLLAWIVSYAPTLIVAAAYMAWKGISTRELINRQGIEETL